uniref:UPA domain-containing protein n=1 Tax=Macrostomum lignano TaxID=282301 RepID=A0A1I8FFD5_9PLAT
LWPANVCVDQLAWGSIGARRRPAVPDGVGRCPDSSRQRHRGPKARTTVFLAAVATPGFGSGALADKQTLLSPVVACGPSNTASGACLRAVLRRFFFQHRRQLRATAARRRRLLRRADTADPEDTVDENDDVDELDDCNDGNETGERCPATEQKQKVSGRCLTYEGSYLRRQPSQQSHQHQQLWRELDATTAPRQPGPWRLPPPGTEARPLLPDRPVAGGGNAVKLLRLAAFAASPMQSSPNSACGWHVLPDTPGRAGAALLTEEQGPGRQAGGLAEAAGFSRRRPAAVLQHWIPFAHVWSGGQAGLHCAFGLEHVDPTRQSVSCKIVVYQNHYYNSRQVVHIVSSKNDLPRFRKSAAARRLPQCCLKSSWNSRRSAANCTPAQTPWRAICRLTRRAQLPAAATGGCLVACLAWSGWLGSWSGGRAPLNCLLDLWEARCRRGGSLIELADSLKAHGQQDAACCCLSRSRDSWL